MATTGAWALRDRTAIAGIGESEYRKGGRHERPELELALEAIQRAVADAGLAVDDVDGLVAYGWERSAIPVVAQELGLPNLSFASLYPGGGNSAAGIVHHAAMAVVSGTADVVVCYRSICQGAGRRLGQARAGSGFGPDDGGRAHGWQAFVAPFGLLSPPQSYAIDAQRHMWRYGTTSQQLAAIAINSYDNAQRNPRAVMHGKPLTLEMHQASRMIADPYRLFDCCLESDGACAVVVTTVERARDLAQPPALIAGAAQGQERWDGPERHRRLDDMWTSAGLSTVARQVYARAGLGPADVDVAQIYENFTGQVVMSLEDFGFCGRGEGGPLAEGGAIRSDGTVPINTAGGNLAEAYIHGFSLVVEAVCQIRGSSTTQIADAGVCLVASGPSAPPSSALVLRGDR